ncbi:MAG: putative glycoside hydrolase [Gemmatimonadales bacterium]
MILTPSTALVAVAALICARGIAAQDTKPPLPPWPAGLHHAEQRPDYLAEIDPRDLSAIRLPPPPPGEPPAVVKGLYLNAWVFGSKKFYDLVALADTTEVNAFVIDVKDGTGYVTYRSSVPVADAAGANAWARAPDVRERLQVLRKHGIHPIARIVVAKDTLLATHKPHWAVRDVDGGLWRDRFGGAWVDAYRDSVWIYAADLAAEAVLLGFREVQFDYVRFPDEPAELLQQAIFPGRQEGESRRAGIRRNLRLLKQRIEPLGIPLTVDAFGLTTSAKGDLGIGQNWEDLLSVADVVLPMVYPSHYHRGAYGFSFPNAEPYGVVKRALEDGLRRAQAIPGAARIRPFLQSFSIRRVRYTAVEVRAEIAAVEDLGLTDWVLWNASGRYPAGAFRPSDSPYVDTTATLDGRSGSR